MWTASLSRREFLEVFASGTSDAVIERSRRLDLKAVLKEETGGVTVAWGQQPLNQMSFPNLAIVREGEISDLLAALNANPSAVSPFSAFCRLVPFEAARAFLDAPRGDSHLVTSVVIDAVAMLSLVEVQLHSEGIMKLRQASPAACRRTLSYVWARALSAGTPESQLPSLPDKWLEIYEVVNGGALGDLVPSVSKHALAVLRVAASVFHEKQSTSVVQKLTEGLVRSDRVELDRAWRDISAKVGIDVSLEGISKAPREERGSLLQKSLQDHGLGVSKEDRDAARGFLATQVAPNSLDHIDILLTRSGPGAAFWYVFFATLQSPLALLSAFGGIGRRLSRDIHDVESFDMPPKADIGFEEIKVFSRFGMDELGRKIGHSNQIEVELLPLVTAAFRFGRTQSTKPTSSSDLSYNPVPEEVISNLQLISSIVNETMASLKSTPNLEKTSKSRRNRKSFY